METTAEIRAKEFLKDGKIKPEDVKTFILAFNAACTEIVETFDDEYIDEMVSDEAECHILGNPITLAGGAAYRGYRQGIKDAVRHIKYWFDIK